MKIFLFSLFLVLSTYASVVAQPPPSITPPVDPPVVPLTGLVYLLLGGGAYGIYRLSRKKDDKNKEA